MFPALDPPRPALWAGGEGDPALPRPIDFDPFPAPPRTVGRGVPRPDPPRRFLALPLPAL